MIFQYASIKSIRDFGINSVQLTDSVALQLILKYSSLVNQLTEQSFIPINSIERLNGGSNRITFVNKNLIKLNSINIVNPDLSRTLVEPSNYETIGNFIKLTFNTLDGEKNLQIDAVFGTIENQKDITIKLTSNIIKDSTSFTVEDSSLLEERDVLVYGNYNIIVNSINYSTNTISIDKVAYNISIPSGTEINVYGCVPLAIENAVKLLVKNYKTLETQTSGKIKSESTDDYSYDLYEMKGKTTGILEVDTILNSFLKGNVDITFW